MCRGGVGGGGLNMYLCILREYDLCLFYVSYFKSLFWGQALETSSSYRCCDALHWKIAVRFSALMAPFQITQNNKTKMKSKITFSCSVSTCIIPGYIQTRVLSSKLAIICLYNVITVGKILWVKHITQLPDCMIMNSVLSFNFTSTKAMCNCLSNLPFTGSRTTNDKGLVSVSD